MNPYFSRDRLLILLTFLIAITLQILPWPKEIEVFRPSWVLLVLIYWVLMEPFRVNVGIGFAMGLCVDFLSGGVLGARSLAFSIVAYLLASRLQLIRNFALWQQAVMVILLSLLVNTIVFWSTFLVIEMKFRPVLFWNSFIDGILWPWYFLLMKKYRSPSAE